MHSISLPPAPAQGFWAAARWVGLALTALLLAALASHPNQTLHILWDLVIPLLPAVFFVNPLVWRNVCPLATINSLASGIRMSPRLLEGRNARAAWAGGLFLLAIMVPARRFLFNTNGLAMAVTIGAVALLAVMGGVLFARRGGFCNSVCPVLPVEKLYGQAPLLPLGTARCVSCSVCTPVGCIELASTKTVRQTIGPKGRDGDWMLTGFGVFAAAFPGFIIGYFTSANGALSTAPGVYGRVLGLAALSYVVVAATARGLRIGFTTALPALGAISLALYYWYAAPGLGQAYGAPDHGALVVRAVAFALIALRVAMFSRRMSQTTPYR